MRSVRLVEMESVDDMVEMESGHLVEKGVFSVDVRW